MGLSIYILVQTESGGARLSSNSVQWSAQPHVLPMYRDMLCLDNNNDRYIVHRCMRKLVLQRGFSMYHNNYNSKFNITYMERQYH